MFCSCASSLAASRQAVPGGGSHCGGWRFAPTPLRCSIRGCAAELAARCALRSNSRGELVNEARCARGRMPCAARRFRGALPGIRARLCREIFGAPPVESRPPGFAAGGARRGRSLRWRGAQIRGCAAELATRCALRSNSRGESVTKRALRANPESALLAASEIAPTGHRLPRSRVVCSPPVARQQFLCKGVRGHPAMRL